MSVFDQIQRAERRALASLAVPSESLRPSIKSGQITAARAAEYEWIARRFGLPARPPEDSQ